MEWHCACTRRRRSLPELGKNSGQVSFLVVVAEIYSVLWKGNLLIRVSDSVGIVRISTPQSFYPSIFHLFYFFTKRGEEGWQLVLAQINSSSNSVFCPGFQPFDIKTLLSAGGDLLSAPLIKPHSLPVCLIQLFDCHFELNLLKAYFFFLHFYLVGVLLLSPLSACIKVYSDYYFSSQNDLINILGCFFLLITCPFLSFTTFI